MVQILLTSAPICLKSTVSLSKYVKVLADFAELGLQFFPNC